MLLNTPLVSPAIVIVFFSHVLAEFIVYVGETCLLLAFGCLKFTVPVPVLLDLTQKESVILSAFEVPNLR